MAWVRATGERQEVAAELIDLLADARVEYQTFKAAYRKGGRRRRIPGAGQGHRGAVNPHRRVSGGDDPCHPPDGGLRSRDPVLPSGPRRGVPTGPTSRR